MRIAQPNDPYAIITAAMLTLTAKHKYRCYNSCSCCTPEHCGSDACGTEFEASKIVEVDVGGKGRALGDELPPH